MWRRCLKFVWVVLFIWTSVALGEVHNFSINKAALKASLKDMSVPFITNVGQTDKKVSFYAKTFGGTVFVTYKGEIVYNLPASKGGVVLKEHFLNANIKAVKGEEKAVTKVNYFIGRDKHKWCKDIPTYTYVSFGEVYKGIEIRLKAYGNRVEKLFYLKPGAEVGKIWAKLEGVKKIAVTKDGRLKVVTQKGNIYFTKPLAYQEINGKRKYVNVAYVCKGNKYGFQLREYDKTKPVIIDPLLASTLLEGKRTDEVNTIAVDSSGNVFVAGYTASSDFPITSGAYDTSYNSVGDAFVCKLSSDLKNLLASTFLGGAGSDEVYALAIDKSGHVFVTGKTSSSNFPTTSSGAYDTNYNGGYSDAFVSKLSNNLDLLLASTFLGGGSCDKAYAIAIDKNGNVFVTGYTDSNDFPISRAYDADYNGHADVFISKLDNNLTQLLGSTFLGGNSGDYPNAIAIDNIGNVFVAGYTNSNDFPISGAYDAVYNSHEDAFVSKLSNDLSTLLASTFLGGGNDDEAEALAIDSSGNVFVTGYTNSSDFPTTSGAYDTSFNGLRDVFICKLSANLSNLYASTFLGGKDNDYAYAIAIGSNNIFVAGRTFSSDFPVTSGAYDTHLNGPADAVVSKLDNNLSNLVASTFLGGEYYDKAFALVVDSSDNVFVTGYTESPDFPTTSEAYDTGLNSENAVFISKLDKDLSAEGNVYNTYNAAPATPMLPHTLTDPATAPATVVILTGTNKKQVIVVPSLLVPENRIGETVNLYWMYCSANMMWCSEVYCLGSTTLGSIVSFPIINSPQDFSNLQGDFFIFVGFSSRTDFIDVVYNYYEVILE